VRASRGRERVGQAPYCKITATTLLPALAKAGAAMSDLPGPPAAAAFGVHPATAATNTSLVTAW
jgi:hypothetical protein